MMGDNSMLELKRIYWTRLGLRLAFAAMMVWLAFSVVAALLPKTSAGARPSSVRGFSAAWSTASWLR